MTNLKSRIKKIKSSIDDFDDNDDNDDNDDGTLFTWLVKTVVTETIENARQVDTLKIRLELKNNMVNKKYLFIKSLFVKYDLSHELKSLGQQRLHFLSY